MWAGRSWCQAASLPVAKGSKKRCIPPKAAPAWETLRPSSCGSELDSQHAAPGWWVPEWGTMESGLQTWERSMSVFILSSLRLRALLPIIASDVSFFIKRILSSNVTDAQGKPTNSSTPEPSSCRPVVLTFFKTEPLLQPQTAWAPVSTSISPLSFCYPWLFLWSLTRSFWFDDKYMSRRFGVGGGRDWTKNFGLSGDFH